jgi:phage gp36-like protein
MYVTLSEMISRFGAVEIIRATNDKTEASVSVDLLAEYAEDPTAVETTPDLLAVVRAVDQAVHDAESVALSHLSELYRDSHGLTAETAPRALIKVTADLARYYLHDNRATERVKDAHDAAMEWLQTAARGRLGLGRNAVGEDPRRSGGPSIVQRNSLPSRVFEPGMEDRFVNGTF